jgi:hypothetical protein
MSAPGALTKLLHNKSEEFYWDDQLDRFALRLRRGADARVLLFNTGTPEPRAA